MLHSSCLHELKADLMADKKGHCPVNTAEMNRPNDGCLAARFGRGGRLSCGVKGHIGQLARLGCTPYYSHVGITFIHSWDSDKSDLTTLTPDQHQIWTIIDQHWIWQIREKESVMLIARDAWQEAVLRFVGSLLFVVVASMVFHNVWQLDGSFCDFRCQKHNYLFHATTCSDRIIWAETMQTRNIHLCLGMCSNTANALIYDGGYWIRSELMGLQETLEKHSHDEGSCLTCCWKTRALEGWEHALQDYREGFWSAGTEESQTGPAWRRGKSDTLKLRGNRLMRDTSLPDHGMTHGCEHMNRCFSTSG